MKQKTLELTKDLNPIDWLKSNDLFPKFFWKSKESQVEVATLGSKLEINDLSEIDNYSNLLNIILNFDLDLKKSRIWLPSFELIKTHDKTTLFSYEDSFLGDTSSCNFKKNSIQFCQVTPCFKDWEYSIKIAKKKIKKIVLARKNSIFMKDVIDPLFIFSNLRKNSSNTFLFFYQPNPFEAFLGASPETLFVKNEQKIMSESIAGTRKKGENNARDILLKKELTKSSKELKEFNFVKDHIDSIYKDICSDYEVTKIDVCETKWVQHLYAKFTGLLKKPITTKDLLSYFHPTPAVGGFPKKQAMKLLNILEPFKRNFYAAPIGRVSKKYSELAVGIRSCYIYKNRIDVFAGTGIIDSSNAKSEWKELQSKSDWIFEMI